MRISVRTVENSSLSSSHKAKVDNEGKVVEESLLVGALPIIMWN